jgi:hypothetical protein
LTSGARPLLSVVAFAALVAAGVGGYRLWTLANAPSPASEPLPDDDLAMLATFTDAGVAGPRDRLAAGAGQLVTTHGDDGAIRVRPVGRGEARVLARVGAPVAGLAVSDGAAWVTSGRTVRRVPLDGGAPVVVSDQLVRPHAIAAFGDAVVVVDTDPDPAPQGMLRASRVVRLPTAPAASGAGLVVLGHYRGEVDGVAADHGAAFWSDPLEGAVLTAAAGATSPSTLATERGLPGAVVIVGDQIVWVERRSESLWAVARTGGAPRRLVQDFAGFAHVTAHADPHGDRVAWVNEAAVEGQFRVLEVPLAGGEATAVSAPVDAIDDLACDGGRLFWLRDGVASPVETGD